MWEGHPIVEAISWEMRACDSMLARSDTGGRATRSVYQYTHGRGLGQEQAKTSFEGSRCLCPSEDTSLQQSFSALVLTGAHTYL